MSEREPGDTTPPERPEPEIPEPPPFDPDPKLIGDMQRGENGPSEKR
jgi:hypothetical protein